MRQFKVETRKTVAIKEAKCDFCPNTTTHSHYGLPDWDKDRNGYSSDTISIQRQKGDNYPEADCRDRARFDMCPECWEKKFLPWAASQGAAPTTEEDPDVSDLEEE